MQNRYWHTVAEIQQLIERAIGGEFDVARIEEFKAAAELLTLLEREWQSYHPGKIKFSLLESEA
jgi:hypothetical protein